MATGLEPKFKEYYSGYVRFFYEDVTIGNRNSIIEFNQDLEVRNQLWNTGVGDYCLDIGAGFGSYTMTALANACGFVFSFECDRNVLLSLRRNLQNNRPLLAMERASVCQWKLNDSDYTIDRYLNELSYYSNRLDWIKIDMGTVPDTRVVLWGCKDTIKTYKPSILIADLEVPQLSFLDGYRVSKQINGHSLLVHRDSI